MKLKTYAVDGSDAGEREFPGFPVFEGDRGVDALRQAILALRANRRQGSASTKTVSEVRGSGRKVHRQKGLGAARAGQRRSPLRRGGGVTFGPKPRSYRQKVNRKVRRLALARALFDGAIEERIFVIEEWCVPEAKTKHFARLLDQVSPGTGRTLVVDDAFVPEFTLAARNVARANLTQANELNALDMAGATRVVVSSKALDALLAKVAEKESSQ